ncbi:MAG: hypothetical protein K0S42_2683 [Microvirga sp.]|nr:hypothetical protein [Microvirga sp.]
MAGLTRRLAAMIAAQITPRRRLARPHGVYEQSWLTSLALYSERDLEPLCGVEPPIPQGGVSCLERYPKLPGSGE